ncbi:unnamed protein product [Alopecurus aequalis]
MATAASTRPSGPVPSIPDYRSASPTRVKLTGGSSASRSPGKSVSVSSPSAAAKSRRSCMCSPTNHPGSFRCSLHKQAAPAGHNKPVSPPSPVSTGGGINRLGGAKRMGSALVRLVGTESGTWARRALAPSPQSQNRRRAAGGFRSRPSRLSAVSCAGDNQ